MDGVWLGSNYFIISTFHMAMCRRDVVVVVVDSSNLLPNYLECAMSS